MERMKFQIMAQKESGEEAKASSGSPVPHSSSSDLDSPTQTTQQQRSPDLSDPTSDTQSQSDSTGDQRIFPPINQPNLVDDRPNPALSLKPAEAADVKHGIPVLKSDKGDDAGNSSSSRGESSKSQSEMCPYRRGMCLGSGCQRWSSSYGALVPCRHPVQAAEAISSSSAPQPTAFPTSSGPQTGQTSESRSLDGTMDPSLNQLQAADAISLPSAPQPSSLQAGETSGSSSSSYGTMTPSINEVQAAEKAISAPSAPTQTAFPESSLQAEQISGSSSLYGTMVPSLNQVQAAQEATAMPSAPSPTASPASPRQDEDLSEKLPSGKELEDYGFNTGSSDD